MYLLCRLDIAVSLLFLLLLVKCFILYTPCVLSGALRYLMIWSIPYKKNK
jgi:hypothetical protein